MKKNLVIGVCLFSFASSFGFAEVTPLESSSNLPEHSSIQKNAASVEVLGRGLLYSINYDRMIDSMWSIGLGLSYLRAGNARFSAIPVFTNYYFHEKSHRPFLTAGLTFAMFKGENDDSYVFQRRKDLRNSVPVFLGAGYEFKSPKGFLLRASPYVLISGAPTLWFGLSAGFCI